MKKNFSSPRLVIHGVIILVTIFFLFQLLSFLGYLWPSLANVVFCLLVLGTIGLSIHKIEYGFLALIFEFLAGHGGHLFEFAGLSLRLVLFLAVMLIWLIKRAPSLLRGRLPRNSLLILFLALLFFIAVGFGQGLIRNAPILAIKDFINYAYFLLIFPLIDILRARPRKTRMELSGMATAATIGVSILTIIVFVLFATRLVQVHDIFYWWWRGVAIGKATFVGNNFFRIVTPAHLLILPLFLIYLSFLAEPKINKKKRRGFIWLGIAASLCLLINFSRAYFLGILAGLAVLARGLYWRRWLIFSLVVIVVLVAEFGLIYALVSGGQVFQGFNFFSQRMGTVVAPEEELSSLARMNILPVLKQKIKQNAILGTGLGATVAYKSPLTNQMETTSHLDWGYLEIWLELGLLGLLTYLSILFLIFYHGWKRIGLLVQDVFERRLLVGLLAGLASIAVATLTGPFLFHPLGIFYLTFTAAVIINYEQHA